MSDDFSIQELLNEQEWRKCFPDWKTTNTIEKIEAFKHFCREHWRIVHPDPDRSRIPFELSDAQQDAIEAMMEERYTLFLKARQIGFSTLVATYCFWLTFGYDARRIVMLSIGQREAIKLLQVAKFGYRSLPMWMRLHGPTCHMTQEKMTFGHDSSIESLPSGSDPARGETVFLAVLDEWASLKNPEDAWASVSPIADVGGRVIALSTAKGEGNIFHKQWIGSKGGGNGTNRFRGLFFPWWACAAKDRDQDWYDNEAKDTPDWQMAQEYPDNPEDAFLRSGRPVFNLQVLRKMEACPPLAEGFLERDELGVLTFNEDGGPLKVWELPQEKVKYVIGADVAEGLDHGDYSSFHVMNSKTRQIVAHYHAHIDSDLFGSEVLNLVGLWYNKALMGVERNNMGTATIKALLRVGYMPMYRQRSLQLRHPQPTESMGWYTMPSTKGLAIGELAGEIRGLKDDEGNWGVNGLIIPDNETMAELRTFVRDGNGKMHGSPHDDRVMSLAICNQMLKYVHNREYAVKNEPPPGTMGYFDRWMENQYHKVMRRIGEHSVRISA